MQTNFSPELLADPHMRASEKIVRTLRALRLLHGDLPDLSAARRRTRFAARAHLSHQGHAGEPASGDRARGQARRSLPVLPRLHDDLPVGRALHAPRRPCARLYRGDLPAPARRPHAARRAFARSSPRAACSAPRCCSPRSADRCGRSSPRIPQYGAKLAAMLALAPKVDPGAGRDRRARGISRERRRGETSAHRAADGLRPGGAGAGDQRRDDPADQPRRRRRRPAERRGLLRLAGASHGPRGAIARSGARQYRRLAARDRAAAASRRSSSPPRDAARRSRTTASCCATTRSMRKRRRGFRRSPRT